MTFKEAMGKTTTGLNNWYDKNIRSSQIYQDVLESDVYKNMSELYSDVKQSVQQGYDTLKSSESAKKASTMTEMIKNSEFAKDVKERVKEGGEFVQSLKDRFSEKESDVERSIFGSEMEEPVNEGLNGIADLWKQATGQSRNVPGFDYENDFDYILPEADSKSKSSFIDRWIEKGSNALEKRIQQSVDSLMDDILPDVPDSSAFQL